MQAEPGPQPSEVIVLLDPLNPKNHSSGQALTEYLLVIAVVAGVVVLALAAWKLPLAHYLQAIVKTLAQPH